MTAAVLAIVVVVSIEVGLRIGHRTFISGFDPEQSALLKGDGVAAPGQFWRELEHLTKDLAQYHPYRWYALPPSISGRYHSTDGFGFRNPPLPSHGGHGGRVGVFGGSTTYSVRTTADNSIPGLLNSRHGSGTPAVQAVNYGLGGYNSTSELMTFVEVTRHPHHGIRWAVFLDGVNEVSRYAEKWQATRTTRDVGSNAANAPFYDVMGYRWTGALYALGNELDRDPSAGWAIGRAFGWISERWRRLQDARLPSPGAQEYQSAGRVVADIYFANLADLAALARAKEIVPLFVLQPTVFELRYPSAREVEIRGRAAQKTIDVGKLYAAAYRQIRADPRFRTLGVHDLGDAFEERRSEIFFDDCHVTSAGNALLASRIAALLASTSTPGDLGVPVPVAPTQRP